MKKTILLILMLLPIIANAYDFEVDGIGYNIVSSKDKTVEADASDLKTIIIPETISYSGISFTVIGVKAYFLSISSISLPSTIEYFVSLSSGGRIGTYDIFISDISKFLRIEKRGFPDEGLYGKYNLYLNNELITEINYPSDCDSITNVLGNCQNNIEQLYIPHSVRKIAHWAFQDCKNLKKVIIDGELKELPSETFSGCINLESIKMSNSIECIGSYCFSGCKNLSNIELPSNLQRINTGAFWGCESLMSIKFPKNILLIGGGAFQGCISLKEITIPQKVISIEGGAFYGCSGLKKITFEGNLHEIGEQAFDGCSSIEEIVSSQNQLYNINENTFSKLAYMFATLIVPIGLKDVYNNSQGWNLFENVTEDESCMRYDILNDNLKYMLKDISSIKYSYSQMLHLKIQGSLTNNSNNVIYLRKYEYVIDDEIIKRNLDPENTHLFAIQPNSNYDFLFDYWFSYYKDDTFDKQSLKKIIFYFSDETSNYLFESDVRQYYTLQYMVGEGEMYITYKIAEGDPIVPETPPTREGYTFSGWSEIPETMPNHDVYVNGYFTINKYKLTYKVDDEEYKSYDVEYASTITPETAPTKEGYTFSGWSEIPETMPANDVTVTGTFTINKYKLIYMVDGVEYKSFEIEYNSTITPEAEPTKDGYKFSGWSEIPETMPAHDVTITGSFERVYSGGDVANLINLLLFGNVDDEDIALYDMNGDGELNIGDLILIMRAAQNNSRNRSAANRAAENQTIEFAADNLTMKPGETSALNISLSSSISGIYGIQFEVNLPEGFSLEKGVNDKIYEMSANQVDDITCNDRDLVNGTYRFFIYSSTLQELKGGSLMSLNLKADADKALGNYSVSISNVALSDYDGHVTKEDGSSVGVKVTNSFTLLYQVDGEDYKSYEIEYGESITPEAEPTKEGYTFSGWSEIPETMPAEDVIVKGTFTVNQYILTYVVDGEVYKEYSYDYGSAITPEAEPTKEGYTFSGWSEIPETMPAKEVYVVGTFTINKYKITYVIDGEVYLTKEVEYGSWITPPNPDDHEGYDFAWEDYPDTMPAHDITINGAYTATGIEAILASEPDVKIFTVSGKPLNKVQKGVNILRYKDGRTRKIVVK